MQHLTQTHPACSLPCLGTGIFLPLRCQRRPVKRLLRPSGAYWWHRAPQFSQPHAASTDCRSDDMCACCHALCTQQCTSALNTSCIDGILVFTQMHYGTCCSWQQKRRLRTNRQCTAAARWQQQAQRAQHQLHQQHSNPAQGPQRSRRVWHGRRCCARGGGDP